MRYLQTQWNHNDNCGKSENNASNDSYRRDIAGFTLVEVVIAFLIIMIALLGVVNAFTYAIRYNTGNNSRAQALAILQEEIELLRSAKFSGIGTNKVVDPLLTGGTKAAKSVTAANGFVYNIRDEVDNDPQTAAIEDEATAPNTALKQIRITVSIDHSAPGWQTAVPITAVMLRTRGN